MAEATKSVPIGRDNLDDDVMVPSEDHNTIPRIVIASNGAYLDVASPRYLFHVDTGLRSLRKKTVACLIRQEGGRHRLEKFAISGFGDSPIAHKKVIDNRHWVWAVQVFCRHVRFRLQNDRFDMHKPRRDMDEAERQEMGGRYLASHVEKKLGMYVLSKQLKTAFGKVRYRDMSKLRRLGGEQKYLLYVTHHKCCQSCLKFLALLKRKAGIDIRVVLVPHYGPRQRPRTEGHEKDEDELPPADPDFVARASDDEEEIPIEPVPLQLGEDTPVKKATGPVLPLVRGIGPPPKGWNAAGKPWPPAPLTSEEILALQGLGPLWELYDATAAAVTSSSSSNVLDQQETTCRDVDIRDRSCAGDRTRADSPLPSIESMQELGKIFRKSLTNQSRGPVPRPAHDKGRGKTKSVKEARRRDKVTKRSARRQQKATSENGTAADLEPDRSHFWRSESTVSDPRMAESNQLQEEQTAPTPQAALLEQSHGMTEATHAQDDPEADAEAMEIQYWEALVSTEHQAYQAKSNLNQAITHANNAPTPQARRTSLLAAQADKQRAALLDQQAARLRTDIKHLKQRKQAAARRAQAATAKPQPQQHAAPAGSSGQAALPRAYRRRAPRPPASVLAPRRYGGMWEAQARKAREASAQAQGGVGARVFPDLSGYAYQGRGD